LIISPYYSIPADASIRSYSALPKLRCFVTMCTEGTKDAKLIAYEIQVNVIPQRTILKDLLLENILNLKNNPLAKDRISLMKEMTCLRGKKGSTIHLKKGERLIRSIR
jgi:hypothetical protein